MITIGIVIYLATWAAVARELLALLDEDVLGRRAGAVVLVVALLPPVLVALVIRWAWLGWRPWRRQPWPCRSRAGSRR